VDLKFPEITDFLDINAMSLQGLMDSLRDMDLDFKVDQLMGMAGDLYDRMHAKVSSHWASKASWSLYKIRGCTVR
jgi:hypothetical protein